MKYVQLYLLIWHAQATITLGQVHTAIHNVNKAQVTIVKLCKRVGTSNDPGSCAAIIRAWKKYKKLECNEQQKAYKHMDNYRDKV